MALDDALEIEISVSNFAVVMSLRGELDLGSSTVFSDELRALDISAPPGTLVIDLSELAFMDSTGLRAILCARESAASHGWEFAIVPGRRQVGRLLSVARIDEHVRLISSLGDLASEA